MEVNDSRSKINLKGYQEIDVFGEKVKRKISNS
jgi:hypothetical protein